MQTLTGGNAGQSLKFPEHRQGAMGGAAELVAPGVAWGVVQPMAL